MTTRRDVDFEEPDYFKLACENVRIAAQAARAGQARAKDVEWQRFLAQIEDHVSRPGGIYNVTASVAAAVRMLEYYAQEGSKAEADYEAAADALEECAAKVDLRYGD